MIYIAKGCQAVLSIPALCCAGVAKGCDAVSSACDDCCKPVVDFFKGACAGLSKTFERPLGCYVFLTVILMLLSLICVGNAFMVEGPYLDETVLIDGQNQTACEEASEVKMLLGTDGFMAFVHVLFALYLQTAVWNGLVAAAEKEETNLNRQEAQGRKAKKKMPVADLILSASGTIFWQNIAFCIYFFVLPAYFVLNYMLMQKVAPAEKEGCDPDGWATETAGLGMAFPVCVLFWSLGWIVFLYFHSCLSHICPFGNMCFGKRPDVSSRARPLQQYASDSEWEDEF